jgi:hypothetical protein
MKKLYKITPYVMLGLMVAGCTDLDTEPLSSTITSDQKEEVVESDPSRLEASVAAVAANFTQYAKIYTEDDNVHSDIGYPTICWPRNQEVRTWWQILLVITGIPIQPITVTA